MILVLLYSLICPLCHHTNISISTIGYLFMRGVTYAYLFVFTEDILYDLGWLVFAAVDSQYLLSVLLAGNGITRVKMAKLKCNYERHTFWWRILAWTYSAVSQLSECLPSNFVNSIEWYRKTFLLLHSSNCI